MKRTTKRNRRGRADQFHWTNTSGNPIYFEFVGVLDLQTLDPECGPDEVWYDIVQMVRPMERRRKLIPPMSRLSAFKNERAENGDFRNPANLNVP